MVEQAFQLDTIFGSLADPTRRDILRRVANKELSISEIAKPYDLTFSAVSKHLKVLENAHLVMKRRRGKEHLVRVVPQTIDEADKYLRQYQKMWEDRFDKLEILLKEEG